MYPYPIAAISGNIYDRSPDGGWADETSYFAAWERCQPRWNAAWVALRAANPDETPERLREFLAEIAAPHLIAGLMHLVADSYGVNDSEDPEHHPVDDLLQDAKTIFLAETAIWDEPVSEPSLERRPLTPEEITAWNECKLDHDPRDVHGPEDHDACCYGPGGCGSCERPGGCGYPGNTNATPI